MSFERIFQEIIQINNNPIEGINVTYNDIKTWVCALKGPNGTLHENLEYIIEMHFPEEYPFRPPLVTFLTPILHPNVIDDVLHLSILSHDWTPVLTGSKILLIIRSILNDPEENFDMNDEAWKLWNTDKDEFKKSLFLTLT